MYFEVTPNNEPEQVRSEEFAAMCAMVAPGFIYFEADLCAPVDHGVPFDLKREMLAQLVAADRSGIVDAEPVQMDYDTADNMLSVLQHETDLLEVAPINVLMSGLQRNEEGRIPRHKFDQVPDLTFDSRNSCEFVLRELQIHIDNYGVATVADYREFVNLPVDHQNYKWGWKNLDGAVIVFRQHQNKFILDLPLVEFL